MAKKKIEEVEPTESVDVGDVDLPDVVVDTREPQARTLKALGLNSHEEWVEKDKKADGR